MNLVSEYRSTRPEILIFPPHFIACLFPKNLVALAALFSYVGLWHGKKILTQFKAALSQLESTETDIHNKLMKSYQEIPEWLCECNAR